MLPVAQQHKRERGVVAVGRGWQGAPLWQDRVPACGGSALLGSSRSSSFGERGEATAPVVHLHLPNAAVDAANNNTMPPLAAAVTGSLWRLIRYVLVLGLT